MPTNPSTVINALCSLQPHNEVCDAVIMDAAVVIRTQQKEIKQLMDTLQKQKKESMPPLTQHEQATAYLEEHAVIAAQDLIEWRTTGVCPKGPLRIAASLMSRQAHPMIMARDLLMDVALQRLACPSVATSS